MGRQLEGPILLHARTCSHSIAPYQAFAGFDTRIIITWIGRRPGVEGDRIWHR